MIAFGDYWSPQNRDGNFSYCNDVNREFIKSYYGTDYEWHLLCIAATRVGLGYDRFTGPWMTTPNIANVSQVRPLQLSVSNISNVPSS